MNKSEDIQMLLYIKDLKSHADNVLHLLRYVNQDQDPLSEDIRDIIRCMDNVCLEMRSIITKREYLNE